MTTWTKERLEQTKQLWADGSSASEIAAIIGGVTRNAVIGKLNRINAPPRLRKAAAPKPKAPSIKRCKGNGGGLGAKLKRKSGKGFHFNMRQDPGSKKPPTIVAPDVTAPIPMMTTLMAITDKECHWPFGDPKAGTMGYCGHKTTAGAYCGFHNKSLLATTPARGEVHIPGIGVVEYGTRAA